MEREEGSNGIVAVAVRPGVVDTEMQRGIREVHGAGMDEGDVARFKGLKEEGGLLRPEQPGNVLGRLAVEAEKELGGKFFRYVDSFVTAGISQTDSFFGKLIYYYMTELTDVVGMHLNLSSSRTSSEETIQRHHFGYMSANSKDMTNNRHIEGLGFS